METIIFAIEQQMTSVAGTNAMEDVGADVVQGVLDAAAAVCAALPMPWSAVGAGVLGALGALWAWKRGKRNHGNADSGNKNDGNADSGNAEK